MVVIISFRKIKLKIGYSIVIFLFLTSFNLYFINYLDSNFKENRNISITSGETIDFEINKEDIGDLMR